MLKRTTQSDTTFQRLFINSEAVTISNNSEAIVEAMIKNHHGLIISASSDLSTATTKQYLKAIKPFLQFINHHGFSFHTLELFKLQLRQEENMAVSTKNGYLAAAKLLVEASHRHGLLPSKIADVSNFKQSKEHKKDGLTKMEVSAVLEHIEAIKKDDRRLKLKAMFYLLAFHGLRSEELVNIKVKDIDFHGSKVWITGKGRDDKEYLPLLHKDTATALLRWINHRNLQEEHFLFSGSRNPQKPISTAYLRELFTGNTKTVKQKNRTIKKQIKGIFDKCNIEGRSLHSFRHFFITYLLECNYTLEEVRQFSRHKTFETIKIYDDRRLKTKLASAVAEHFIIFTNGKINGIEEEVERSEEETIETLIMEYRTNKYSFDKIADCLNEQNYRTKKGGMFYASTVQRIYNRYLNRT